MFAQPQAYFYVRPDARAAEIAIWTQAPLESCVLTLYGPDEQRVVSVDTAVRGDNRIRFKVPEEFAGKALSLIHI